MTESRPLPRAQDRQRALSLCIAVGLVATLSGCFNRADKSASEVESAWSYWLSPHRNFDLEFRVAMLLAEEGWGGSSSRAPKSTLFSELFSDGSLRLQIMTEAEGLATECPQNGCYLYARTANQAWTVLHAVPSDDEQRWLNLSRPWALQALLETGRDVEVNIPVNQAQRRIYTFRAGGYSRTLHGEAEDDGINGDGTTAYPAKHDEDGSPDWLDGPPPDDVTWPVCVSSKS